MAQRGKPSAPAKTVTRKNHGPKKKMWHCWDSTTRLHFAQAGLLTKYHNKESFDQSLNARGIKTDLNARWSEFISTPKDQQKEYFKNIHK